MFEHMAFKGTDQIGTTDYAAEKPALAKVETSYAAYIKERDKTVGRDDAKLKQLEKDWKDDIAAADKFVKSNEFGKTIEQNGGEDMNANTSYDETAYHYSLPENRLELWAYLESERFVHPVLREFYKERNVVIEERRLRTDSNPIGRLIEQFTAEAFEAHPYHRPTVGWMADLNSLSATEAQQFFDKYYVPSNMVVAVAGDVKSAEAMPVLEKYFGRLAVRPQPDESTTTEPPQNSERKVVLKEHAQPLYIEGYHRPDYRSKDDAIYDAISDLMSEGRTSRLYRSLVRDKKIASFSAGFSGLPGVKYPHLFAFYAFPLPGHTTQEVADGIHAEIDKLKKEDITDDELKMIKTRTKAGLIRGLADNEGLATQLATYQTRYGDWRELFRSVDRIDQVSKADIRRVANAIFVDTNRTVGIIETGGGGGMSGRERIVTPARPRLTRPPTLPLIREVRNENEAHTSPPAVRRRGLCDSGRRADHKLEADSHSPAPRIQAAATEAHRTSQRHGDLPPGRSRTSSDRWNGPHPRGLAQ